MDSTPAPVCQSCGMPLNDENRGTDADDSKNEIYCRFCYENGAFTKPDLTLEKQRERLVEMAVASGVSLGDAEKQAQKLGELARWKK